jgi:hypothetical protein
MSYHIFCLGGIHVTIYVTPTMSSLTKIVYQYLITFQNVCALFANKWKNIFTDPVIAPSIGDMKIYRCSFQNFAGHKMQARAKLRTFIGFLLQSTQCPELQYLRVLHVEDSKLDNSASAIKSCLHLRYLRLISCEGDIPSSLSQLVYLQTIDFKETRKDQSNKVPKAMWHIPSLRHAFLESEFSPPSSGKQCTELQTFSLE